MWRCDEGLSPQESASHFLKEENLKTSNDSVEENDRDNNSNGGHIFTSYHKW
jgi:hypothetical protein